MQDEWSKTYIDDIRDRLAAHADAVAHDPEDAAVVAARADDVRAAVSRYEERLLSAHGASSPLRFLPPPVSLPWSSPDERDPEAAGVLITVEYLVDVNVDDFAYRVQLRYGDEEADEFSNAMLKFVENEIVKFPPTSVAKVRSVAVNVELANDKVVPPRLE